MKIGSNPSLIGHHRILLNRVGSTQDFALELLKVQPNLHGTLILAHSQENGKGRFSKKWESNDGENFLGSFIVQSPITLHQDNYALINMFTSVAIQETIEHIIKQDVKIKWPNDILVSNKKVAGLLIYNQWRTQHLASSILGIGINLNQSEFPEHLQMASSLKIMGKLHIDKTAFIDSVITSLNKWYSTLHEGETATLIKSYHDRLFGINDQISFEMNGYEYFGKIIEVALNGKIRIVSSLGKNEWYDIDQIKINY